PTDALQQAPGGIERAPPLHSAQDRQDLGRGQLGHGSAAELRERVALELSGQIFAVTLRPPCAASCNPLACYGLKAVRCPDRGGHAIGAPNLGRIATVAQVGARLIPATAR